MIRPLATLLLAASLAVGVVEAARVRPRLGRRLRRGRRVTLRYVVACALALAAGWRDDGARDLRARGVGSYEGQ